MAATPRSCTPRCSRPIRVRHKRSRKIRSSTARAWRRRRSWKPLPARRTAGSSRSIGRRSSLRHRPARRGRRCSATASRRSSSFRTWTPETWWSGQSSGPTNRSSRDSSSPGVSFSAVWHSRMCGGRSRCPRRWRPMSRREVSITKSRKPGRLSPTLSSTATRGRRWRNPQPCRRGTPIRIIPYRPFPTTLRSLPPTGRFLSARRR